MKRFFYCLGITLLSAILTVTLALPFSTCAQGLRPEASITGKWSTSWTIMEYGAMHTYNFYMELTKTGNTITGISDFYNWQINGTLAGDNLTGTWSCAFPNVSTEHPHTSGQFTVIIDPSGTSLKGLFKGQYHWLWDERFTVTGKKIGTKDQPDQGGTTPSQPGQPAITPSAVVNTPSTPCLFTGKWKTSFGEMNLVQNGNILTGSYTWDNGQINGTVNGNTATGTWTESGTYKNTGDFIFKLASDCRSFTGKWRYGTCDWDGDIIGKRSAQTVPDNNIQPAPDTNNQPPPQGPWIAGTWKTQWGTMVLGQSGNTVTGTYTHDNGKITGTVSGNTFSGWWSESPSYSPPKDAGQVELTISADHKTMSGRWRYGSSGTWYENDWQGTFEPGTPKLITATACDLTGTWDFDWSNSLKLTQTGSNVSGAYVPGGWSYTATIQGTVDGNRLSGTWTEQDRTGKLDIIINPDCNSFTGRYTHSLSSSSSWYNFHNPGKRLSQPSPSPSPTPTPQPANLDWSGDWDTDWGKMQIALRDTSASGTYTYNNGKMTGTVSDHVLTGDWAKSPSYAAPKDAGSYEFVMSKDGLSFRGKWKYSDCKWDGDWNGSIAGATPLPPNPDVNPAGNLPPKALFFLTPQSPKTGDTIAASSQSSDPNGDALQYAWTRDGATAAEYANQPYCLWLNPAAGTHTITLTVNDGKGGANSYQSQFIVTSAPQPQPTPSTNQSPTAYFVITPQSPRTVDTIIASSQSTDPDGDVLTLSWSRDGIQVREYDSSPYMLWANPPAGIHTIGLMANDNKGGINTYQFQIHITQDSGSTPGPTPPGPTPGPTPTPSVNNPPTALFIIDPPQPQRGGSIKVTSQSTDIDNDKLSHLWALDGENMGQHTGQTNWTWKNPPSGGHVLQLTVDDGKGGRDTLSRRIKIPESGKPDNGSGNWKIGPFSCFIATAAYGSETAAELDTLRLFRDRVLMQSGPGRLLIDTYYRLSPPLAEYIAQHEGVRVLVRELALDPVVEILKQTRSLWDSYNKAE